jgi:hypothetical protein
MPVASILFIFELFRRAPAGAGLRHPKKRPSFAGGSWAARLGLRARVRLYKFHAAQPMSAPENAAAKLRNIPIVGRWRIPARIRSLLQSHV